MISVYYRNHKPLVRTQVKPTLPERTTLISREEISKKGGDSPIAPTDSPLSRIHMSSGQCGRILCPPNGEEAVFVTV